MKLDLAFPAAWVMSTRTREGRELVEVDGGLTIEIDLAVPAPHDATALLEAIVARDPIAGTTIDRAGHVTAHTTEGTPFTLSSLKLRDANHAVVEGRLIAYYVFGDVAVAVTCRLRQREALATFGPALDALFASARLDRDTAPARVDDLYS